MSAVDLSDLTSSLEWLAKRGWLSGSLARGKERAKDIDVCVNDRTIASLKALLREQNVPWDSPFIGCITWYPDGVQLETSTLFPRYKTGPKSVYGVEFRT